MIIILIINTILILAILGIFIYYIVKKNNCNCGDTDKAIDNIINKGNVLGRKPKLEPKPLEPKPLEPKLEPKPLEPKLEPKPLEPKPLESKPLEPKLEPKLESKPLPLSRYVPSHSYNYPIIPHNADQSGTISSLA